MTAWLRRKNLPVPRVRRKAPRNQRKSVETADFGIAGVSTKSALASLCLRLRIGNARQIKIMEKSDDRVVRLFFFYAHARHTENPLGMIFHYFCNVPPVRAAGNRHSTAFYTERLELRRLNARTASPIKPAPHNPSAAGAGTGSDPAVV